MYGKTQRYIFSSFLALLLCCSKHAQADALTQTLLATPRGGPVFFRGKTVQSEELNTAIKKARSGDTVLILPGTYNQKLDISKKVDPDRPITVMGIDGLTVFNCNHLPADEGKAPISLSGARGLIFRGLRFEDCWPGAFNISDSDHIAISGNTFSSGKFPILLTHRSLHHIIVEDNEWRQYAKDEMLQHAAKDFTASPTLRNYVGSFVHAQGIAGDLIIRRNKIKAAFGGVLLGEGPTGTKESVKNVRIYQNTFENLTTQAISGNADVANLWIHENKFRDVQSVLESSGNLTLGLFVYANHIANTKTAEHGFLVLKQNGAATDQVFVFNNTLIGATSVLNTLEHKSKAVFENNKTDDLPLKSPLAIDLVAFGTKQHLVPSENGSDGLKLLPVYVGLDTPYQSKAIATGFRWEKNQVLIDLSLATPLKGLNTITLSADNAAPVTSKPCIQKKRLITCPLPGPINHKSLEAWLEVKDETALEAWGSEVELLKLVRKPN